MKQLLIVGLGLIGGSIARASKGYFEKIYAIDKDAQTLAQAEAMGVIDRGFISVKDFDQNVDLIALCTPVGLMPKVAAELAKKQPHALFTDAGSTKKTIVQAMKELGVRYVGTHPMAGSERSGFAASRADLFYNATYCIITDNAFNEDIELVKGWILHMGGRPINICADEHDCAVAAVSHLPHLLASALVATAADTAKLIPQAGEMAAGGFLDMTRIASSDPTMWQHIFIDNGEKLNIQLQGLIQKLQIWSEKLGQNDKNWIFDEFSATKGQRGQFLSNNSGIFPGKGYDLLCTLPKEDNALANTVLLLHKTRPAQIIINDETAHVRFASYNALKEAEGFLKAQGVEVATK